MEKNQPKISVIIPVYGVEKYIRQCLESVINQTYKNLEIIVVNDGTKDNSMTIVEEYLSDKRIKIINKQNGGLSSARNKGMEEASGEYISFVDSDDWIDLNLYKNIIEKLENEDIYIFNILEYDEVTKKTKKSSMINIKQLKDYTKGYLYFSTTYYACWNKIYKRKFLENFNIKFIDKIIYEDVFWGIETFFQTDKVNFLEFNGYYYRINRYGSIMNKVNLEKEKISIKTIHQKIIEFKKREMSNGAKIIINLEEEKWRNYYNKKFKYYKLDKILKRYYNNKLEKNEKNKIKQEIEFILKGKKNRSDINIFEYFYLKNGFINFKIIRRNLIKYLKRG